MFRKRFLLSVLAATFILWASAAQATSLKVALYPYVPRIDQFKTVIADAWEKVEKDVPIIWAENWDGGYSYNPQNDYDLFVFDATYLTYFKNEGCLLGIPEDRVEKPDDFLTFIREGLSKNGQFWAIPQLGCTEYLIYKKTDQPLTGATTMTEVITALGKCSYYGNTPPCSHGSDGGFFRRHNKRYLLCEKS
jgi:thiamine pyridinylase